MEREVDPATERLREREAQLETLRRDTVARCGPTLGVVGDSGGQVVNWCGCAGSTPLCVAYSPQGQWLAVGTSTKSVVVCQWCRGGDAPRLWGQFGDLFQAGVVAVQAHPTHWCAMRIPLSLLPLLAFTLLFVYEQTHAHSHPHTTCTHAHTCTALTWERVQVGNF